MPLHVSRIRAICFDVDGTLSDTDDVLLEKVARFLVPFHFLFPKMEVTSKAYIVLSQVDFFQIWVFGVLAFGLAAIFKINVRKALFLSYTLWFLKALFNSAISILFLSFVQ